MMNILSAHGDPNKFGFRYDTKKMKEIRTFLETTPIKLSYWCETKEEKQELLKILNENEEKAKQKERQLKEGNFNNLFKENVNEIENNTDLVQYKKESLIQKLFHKIKKLLNKS